MTKKLFIALKKLVKTNGAFEFGFHPVPKGTEYNIDKGLNEDMEMELRDWILNYLAPQSEHHSTDYKLTFEGDIINLDCEASWGGWPYEDLHTNYDLLKKEVVNLLLPKIDYSDVEIEFLNLAFECTFEGNNSTYNWWSDCAYYYDDETEIDTEIPLEPIKTDLEKVLNPILCDFDASGFIERDGIHSKTIYVEESRPSVVESLHFKLEIDLDEYEFEDD